MMNLLKKKSIINHQRAIMDHSGWGSNWDPSGSVLGPLVSQWAPLKRPWRGCFAQRAFNLDFLTWKIILATQGENMESISMSWVLDSWVHHQKWSWKSSEILPDPSDPVDPFASSIVWLGLWMKAAPVLPSKHAGEGTSKAWHPQHHICHSGEMIRFNRCV